jgi:hypothetical protein
VLVPPVLKGGAGSSTWTTLCSRKLVSFHCDYDVVKLKPRLGSEACHFSTFGASARESNVIHCKCNYAVDIPVICKAGCRQSGIVVIAMVQCGSCYFSDQYW